MNKNHILSERLAKATSARPKACWPNARSAMLYGAKHQPQSTVMYVEGWCVMQDLPIVFEHDWLEVDGWIVDPTLPDYTAEKYFPGICYSAVEVREWIAEIEGDALYGPICWTQYGWGGFNHLDYVRSNLRAHLASGIPIRFLREVHARWATLLDELEAETENINVSR